MVLYLVIPREGVESLWGARKKKEGLELVIPREGVESASSASKSPTSRGIGDPERGS